MDVRDHEGIRWGSGGFWQRLNWLKFGAKEIKGDQVYQVFKNGVAGWWFGTFGLFFHILGMSSSQLLLTPSFFRGLIGWCKRGGCHVSMALGNSRLKPGKLSGSQESNNLAMSLGCWEPHSTRAMAGQPTKWRLQPRWEPWNLRKSVQEDGRWPRFSHTHMHFPAHTRICVYIYMYI